MTLANDRPTWHAQAACRGMDTDLFMPERGDHSTIRNAVAVCRTCPVIDPCREYAVVNNEQYGIWGGTSERQRRILRRGIRVELGAPPCGPIAGHLRAVAS